MATARDGQNPGRSATPQRQSPGRMRNGRGTDIDAAQVPSTIFGAHTALGSTGLPGSAKENTPGDVTQVSDQSYEGISGQHVTHDQTTLAGTQGATDGAGGESVTYTDPFAIQGGVLREVTTNGAVSGDHDWTQSMAKYATGPTLPGIAGNRPTDTGLGRGRIRGAGKGL